jgi:hypothetical protein
LRRGDQADGESIPADAASDEPRTAVIMRTPLGRFNLPAARIPSILKILWYLCRGNVSWKASDD